MDSILNSIKMLIGITPEYKVFDANIIMHINSVFSILTQLGVGPDKGFSIKDESAIWTDFIPEDNQLEDVKTYMSMKVKLMFDPPASSVVMECMNRMINELEWRINSAAENSSANS